jgi:uncharacterized protein (DUF111 family)
MLPPATVTGSHGQALTMTGELVTPTGAALLATLARFERPGMTLERVGHGAGGRDPAWPNVLRLWLGEALDGSAGAQVGDAVLLEANIDDMQPELYGHVTERLFALGALDVWLSPVQMKKGRPGIVLGVLAPPALEGTLAELLLAETTTLGVRVQPARRHVAGRRTRTVQTPFGPIPVKEKLAGERVLGSAPEYEACRAAAHAAGVPLAEVYAAARAAARESGEPS